MMTQTWIAGLFVLLSSCGGKAPSDSTSRRDDQSLAGTSFVLVHGAWMGAWGWSTVAGGLRERGAAVTAVELPGHGDDQTPVSGATLDAYVATVETAIASARGKVVVVGHSLGGVVITQLAERTPAKIDKLVYLAAYVPKDKQTLQELGGTDAASHVGPVIKISPETGLAAIPKDQLQDVFCADCASAQLATLAARYRDEPLPAFVAPVQVTATNWGRVAKYYIYTTQDHAVSHELQQRMTAGIPWASTATLDTSHAPFLSRPDLVVTTLAGFARS